MRAPAIGACSLPACRARIRAAGPGTAPNGARAGQWSPRAPASGRLDIRGPRRVAPPERPLDGSGPWVQERHAGRRRADPNSRSARPNPVPARTDLLQFSQQAAGLGPRSPGRGATLSYQFADVLFRGRAAATTRVPVLLHGESGSGKEVLARAIHTWSGRGGEFVAVNCGAIPQNLVESELFGHRKGAFSGAERDRPGLLRTSDGGTLF